MAGNAEKERLRMLLTSVEESLRNATKMADTARRPIITCAFEDTKRAQYIAIANGVEVRSTLAIISSSLASAVTSQGVRRAEYINQAHRGVNAALRELNGTPAYAGRR